MVASVLFDSFGAQGLVAGRGAALFALCLVAAGIVGGIIGGVADSRRVITFPGGTAASAGTGHHHHDDASVPHGCIQQIRADVWALAITDMSPDEYWSELLTGHSHVPARSPAEGSRPVGVRTLGSGARVWLTSRASVGASSSERSNQFVTGQV
jgi:hypothetical protein